MNAVEFRKRLESVVGEGQYRRFVNSLNHGDRWLGRFRFWQEALLAEAGVTASSPAELYCRVEPLLRVCLLHRVELKVDPAEFAGRCRGARLDSADAQAKSFPNTDCGPSRPGDRFDNIRQGLWYCPKCRVAKAGQRQQTA